MSSESQADHLALPLQGQLPSPPKKALGPLLDATVACIVRHGLSKTTMSDIARELGVAPSTVYRNVGSVENAALMVATREVHRFVTRMPEIVDHTSDARAVTVLLTEAIRSLAAHPMAEKILRDEADWICHALTGGSGHMLDWPVGVATSILSTAMSLGVIRRQDPEALANWVVRIGMISLLAPPPGDLQIAIEALLLPALQPPSQTEA